MSKDRVNYVVKRYVRLDDTEWQTNCTNISLRDVGMFNQIEIQSINSIVRPQKYVKYVYTPNAVILLYLLILIL